MPNLTTTPITNRETQSACGIERLDEPHSGASWMCNKEAVRLWHPTPGVTVPVCAECLRWLRTLESLGQLK